jgi:hypothetical protein
MAARSKVPAPSASSSRLAAPQPAEGSWLLLLVGESPALDGASLDVFAILPKLPAFSALERLAGLLSSDPRFGLVAAWAEELPFPARGHAVVDLREGRVLAAAVPEDARRRLEEHRGSALPLIFDSYRFDLSSAESLWRLTEKLGGRLELLGLEPPHPELDATAAVLRLPRPPTRGEWEEIVESIGGLWPRPLWFEDAKILHSAGLAPLAFMLPSRLVRLGGSERLEWKPRPSNWQGGFVVLARWWRPLRDLPPLLERSGLFRETPDGLVAEGPRGAVLLKGENLFAKPVALDRRFFEDAEEALLALERPSGELSSFLRAVGRLVGSA